jgi:hypothetical protein
MRKGALRVVACFENTREYCTVLQFDRETLYVFHEFPYSLYLRFIHLQYIMFFSGVNNDLFHEILLRIRYCCPYAFRAEVMTGPGLKSGVSERNPRVSLHPRAQA